MWINIFQEKQKAGVTSRKRQTPWGLQRGSDQGSTECSVFHELRDKGDLGQCWAYVDLVRYILARSCQSAFGGNKRMFIDSTIHYTITNYLCWSTCPYIYILWTEGYFSDYVRWGIVEDDSLQQWRQQKCNFGMAFFSTGACRGSWAKGAMDFDPWPTGT